MEVDDWSINLVFELPDGSFHDEPRHYHAALDEALARARRDANGSTFGRTFRGFSRVEQSSSGVGNGALPRGAHLPTNSALPLEDLLTKLKLQSADVPERVAVETARHDVKLEGVDRFPWWDFEGAFGIATDVGLRIARCTSTDADEAEAAADMLGHLIAHQHQLFPVTSHALPWVLTLIEAPQVSCRKPLAAWLELITRAAVAGSDPVSKMLAWTARVVARDLATAMDSHQHAAKEVKTVLRGLKPRLEKLKKDPVVGANITAVLDLL
ncbi:MAG: hypothetical protein QM817_06440 [Archangium sp.]